MLSSVGYFHTATITLSATSYAGSVVETPNTIMTLAKRTLRVIRPQLNENGLPSESESDYAARVQSYLPDFPRAIIIQWFYDHPQCIDQYSWLDYQSLQFTLTKFGNEKLTLPCLACNETVVQYRDHFLNGDNSRRMKRIADYIRTEGTWPLPPIILDNPNSKLTAPNGLRYAHPYDLLEGNHRMAVLYALIPKGLVHSSHNVWLVTR